MAEDPYNLSRFEEAQRPVIEGVLEELRRGRKETHWMWFVFPQVAGLGFSATARFYAIGSRAEAEAYLAHAILGARLRQCAELVLGQRSRSAAEIFGYPDDLKLCSSMTLFAAVSPPESVFHEVIEAFFNGAPDTATLDFLADNPAQSGL